MIDVGTLITDFQSLLQDEEYQTLNHFFFKETVIYREPANDCEAIYGQ